MRKHFTYRSCFIVASVCVVSVGFANTVYRVKQGENLSRILSQQKYPHLYGSRGAIARTLELNPGLKKSGGNLIFPGMSINLPGKVEKEFTVASGQSTDILDLKTSTVASEPVHGGQDRKISHEDLGHIARSRSRLGVGLKSQFLRLVVDPKRGTGATLISDPTFGVSGAWEQHWSSSFSSFAEFDLTTLTFRKTRDTNQILQSRSHSLFGLRLGGVSRITPRFDMMVDLAYREVPVTRAIDSSIALVEEFNIPQVGFEAKYEIYSIESLKFYGGGGLRLNIPNNQKPYSSQLSTEKVLNLGIRDRISHFNLSLDTFYSRNDLKMKETNFSLTTLGMHLRAGYEF